MVFYFPKYDMAKAWVCLMFGRPLKVKNMQKYGNLLCSVKTMKEGCLENLQNQWQTSPGPHKTIK
jgi:hypothetical protein